MTSDNDHDDDHGNDGDSKVHATFGVKGSCFRA
jgi:hypothetical protein